MAGTGVRTTHPTYDKLQPKWQRCSDCVDGQDALHARGEAYIAKLTDEEDKAYKARLMRSDYFNATWRTIAGLTGMAFRKPPTVKVPAAIEPMLADIDLAGCALDDMAKGLVEDMLEYGAFGLLVDYPPQPENVVSLSVAAAEAQGMRPLVQYYEIESVLNWRYKRIGNRQMLCLVVLKECADVAEDAFSHKTEDRYRVLDLDERGVYRQRVFRVDDKTGKDEQVGNDVFPLMNGKPMAEIPFRIVGELDTPPLIDLVDANIAHYQVNSDYRHGLHFTGLPTLFLAGVQTENPIYIGGSAAISTTDPNAKAAFIEFTGQGLQPSRDALQSLEQRMAVLGARMLADESKQVETLGATQIKRAGENSILASIASEVSEAIEWALDIFAEWAGSPGEVAYQINRDYGTTGMDGRELTALVAAVQAGEVSSREFFELLQRHDVIDPAKTFEEHQAEVDAQAPLRPLPPAANSNGGIAA